MFRNLTQESVISPIGPRIALRPFNRRVSHHHNAAGRCVAAEFRGLPRLIAEEVHGALVNNLLSQFRPEESVTLRLALRREEEGKRPARVVLHAHQGAVLLGGELALVAPVDLVEVVPAHAAAGHRQHHRAEEPGCALEGPRAPLAVLLVQAGDPLLAVQLGAGLLDEPLQRVVHASRRAREVPPALEPRPLGGLREQRGRHLRAGPRPRQQLRHPRARGVAPVQGEVLRAHVRPRARAPQLLPVRAHAAPGPARLLPDLDVDLSPQQLPEPQSRTRSGGAGADY
mmetsp:Transcript_11138/g.31320  ORF Transcript_11138/g.31320 Transcript_11138/m.31320 type:complete len:285 (-) Transcript_11138:83-937(-)